MRMQNVMAASRFFACIVLVAVGTGAALAAQTIKTNDMGLSKTSVFDVPEPKVYHYNTAQPGQSKVLPRAYPGSPPQIPHDIRSFLPITAKRNMCVLCHNQPNQWGKQRATGTPTPMPTSHYTDLRNAPGKVTDQPIRARFNCDQCHVPQADAPALVGNTFSSKPKR